MSGNTISVHRCGDCGFDGTTVAATDAAVAVRSYGRRWRELFDRVIDEQPLGDEMLHWQLASGWRPIDRVRRLVHAYDRLATQLELIWARDDPYLDAIGDAPAAVPTTTSDALDELDRACQRLATVIDQFDGAQWTRVGHRTADVVTALDLAREAVHEGSHDLRACQRDLEEASGHRLDDDGEADAA